MKKPTLQERVREEMKQILRGKTEGMRNKDLTTEIHAKMPTELWHSISALLSSIADTYPEGFEKIKAQGEGTRYYLRDVDSDAPVQDNSSGRQPPKSGNTPIRKEEDFYESFAHYLEYGDDESDEENHLSECSKAVPWGGNKSGGVWGTPDVVGIFRPEHNADVKFPDEIVSAEIKIDNSSTALITAFGQACSYLLFSHKVYLVIPKIKSKDARNIESRCYLLGIGLVHFDPNAEEINPSIYTKVLRARAHSPDMFQVKNFIQGKLAQKLRPK